MMTPNIAIWSIFRNDGERGVNRYRQMVNALDYPAKNLRFYLGEGDSTDDTYQHLETWAASDRRVRLTKTDTGLPYHSHIVHPERFACLQLVSNACIDQLAADNKRKPWADYGMLIESDLILPPNTLTALLDHKPADCGVIAPMIWIDHGIFRFYDIWAFRSENGHNFPPQTPPWYEQHHPMEPYRVQSVGSAVLFDVQAILSGARYTGEEVIVGMVKAAGHLGYKIYCDPNVHVLHPKIGSTEGAQGR